MTQSPLVSICIPTYNGADFLQESLDTILVQDYNNLEVIISDDNSKDSTLDIVESFKNECKFPVTILNHEPNGIGANWNNCIKNSRGKYIKFLFQDDLLHPTCVSSMVDFAETDSEIVFVASNRTIIYNHQNKAHLHWVKLFSDLFSAWSVVHVTDKSAFKGKKILRDKNLLNVPHNKIGEPPATLIRRSVFNKVGYFDEQMKQALDIEFWYRAMKAGKVGFLTDKLITFRLHENQASFVNHRAGVNEEYEMLRKIGDSSFWYLNYKFKKEYIYRDTLLGALYVKIKKSLINN